MPAALSLALDAEAGTLSAGIQAPDWGYRLIDLEGTSATDPDDGMDGRNPARVPALVWTLDDGSTLPETPDAVVVAGASVIEVVVPEGAVQVTVTDAWGNQGTLDLP